MATRGQSNVFDNGDGSEVTFEGLKHYIGRGNVKNQGSLRFIDCKTRVEKVLVFYFAPPSGGILQQAPYNFECSSKKVIPIGFAQHDLL